ncbi:MAG: TRAP transporter substrate-binding protein [Desulfobacterales bacterium]|jgi:tripartite ATP-independent transporter DctP family solute receptor|nr:TRAP transporter substrate-binding protein [Desulfobacterales bacterium]
MKQKLFFMVLVACLWAVLTGGEAAAAQSWDLKLSHVLSPTSDYQIMTTYFAELLAKKTGGKVKVTGYPSGQLGNERVAFEQLQMGALDMAISGTPVLSAWVPEGQVFDLPYLVQTREQGLALLNGKTGDWWRETLRQRTGVRSLGFLDYGFRQVYNKTRPINTPEDLKGLKLRVLENPSYIATYSALGVKATPMAYGEVYTALQQGVIDGGEANALGYVNDKFVEVAKYFSYTSATYNPITLLINDALYSSFPADIRQAFDEAAKEALAYQKEVLRKMDEEAVAKMKAAGVTITQPDLGPFVKAVRPAVWNQVMGRIPKGKDLVDQIAKEADALLPKK